MESKLEARDRNAEEARYRLANPDPRGFLAMLDASAPRIAAGVLRPITSDDITQAIADARP